MNNRTIEDVKAAIDRLENSHIKQIDNNYFRYRLAIGEKRCNELLKALELGGTISKCDENGMRKVYMNSDD